MIEIMAVLIIIGILVAVAAPRFINMASETKQRAACAGIAQYNGQEKLLWSKIHITQDFSTLTDAALDKILYDQMDFNLNSGSGSDWVYGNPAAIGGTILNTTLKFKDEEIAIIRTPATAGTPALWTLGTSGSFSDTTFTNLTSSANWTVSDDGTLTITGSSSLLIEGSESDVVNETFTATLTSGRGFGFYYLATEAAYSYQNVIGYTFQVDPGAGNAFLIKDAATDKNITYTDEDGNTQTARIKASDVFESDFDINAAHTYSVDVTGTQQTIKVDGVTVFSFTDNTYTSGQTGFRTWSRDTTVTID